MYIGYYIIQQSIEIVHCMISMPFWMNFSDELEVQSKKKTMRKVAW